MVIFLLAGLLGGCNLPRQKVTETVSQDAVFTSVALTIYAGQAETQQPSLPQANTAPAGNATTQPLQTAVPMPTDTVPPAPTAVPPTNTPEPTQTETPTLSPTPSAIPGAILEDDFSNTNGWYKYEGDNYGFKYVDDSYHIYNKIANANIWSVKDASYHNIRIDVDVKRVDGPDDGFFGVVCRFKNDGDDYYALVIGDNGFYGIGRMKDGDFAFLKKGIDDNGIIHRGKNQSNRVSGVCKGKQLTLFANGKQLVQVFDNAFGSGDIGLVVGNTFHQGGTEVKFDNYALLTP